jgi:hypothetical protein
MFAEQRSRLALLSVFGAFLVFASPSAAQTDPTLPSDCQRAVAFDPGQFGSSTVIDNQYLPLTPGTQLVLEGRASRTGMPLPHTVTFTVTDLIKVIDGVRSRVMWDVDVSDGEVVEAELAFFAQDDAGNVWNLGEYPEEFEDGFFLGAPNTWIAGLEDAEAGIHMLAQPKVGASYLQGLAPKIAFLDCATVFAEGLRVCPPFACYDNVLETHERSPLDPTGGVQTKSHAPDVGIVQVGALNDPEGETLVLVDRVQLDQASMDAVRQEALKLDQRGFRVSEVYCQTEPIAPNPAADCSGPPIAPGTGGSPSGGTPPTPVAPAPAAPVVPTKPGPKPGSQPKSCYAKHSRRSARRSPRRHSRVFFKKMARKTCAERLTRR